jgi:isoquinoline 1-oxidoreductase
MAKDYLELDFYDLQLRFSMDRRQFLKLTAGGIMVFFAVDLAAGQRRWGQQLPTDINAFLKIGEDGKVTGFTGKIEMGQGVITSLSQMLADELDVPLESVDLIMGDTDLCPWDMGTFGSMTTRFFGPPFRAAAAEAKAILIELASEKWSVPKGQLQTEKGYVIYNGGRKKISYAELTEGKKINRKLSTKAVLESASDFTIVSKPLLRKDAEEKVTGRALFAGDIRRPGMLFAKILRPPSHDSTLKSLDLKESRKISGIQIVEHEDLIAFLHDDLESAEKARELADVHYDTPKSSLTEKTIFEHLLKVAPEGETISEQGNLNDGEANSTFVVEETYYDGYVAHAPIEPHTAIAEADNEGKITIWASTQTPFGLKDEAAEALGVPPEKVRVITPYVGGGFGGKTANRQGVEAARLAKAAGRPVQVAWTREEEFFYDTFRPAAIVKVRAGVDSNGRIASWDFGTYFAGQRGSEHFYDIPHHKTVAFNSGWRGAPGSHPFVTGAWRAPSNNSNTFARECHISLLAHKAGIDQVAFRLQNLKDEKMKRVLETAAEKFGWKPEKSPSGRGIGVACGIDAGTYVAHLAEIKVDKNSGRTKVMRIVCAQDMGLCINPEGSRIQIEGCITMGLGYALSEELHFRGGEVLDKNFGTYEIPRFSWLPQIETHIIDARDQPAQGGGEPAIICMGAVIANGIFDATGAWVRQMPMTPERIKIALTEV